MNSSASPLISGLWDGLNPNDEKGIFAIVYGFEYLRGYIDESGRDHLFTLACVFTEGAQWFFFELAWRKCLEEVNASLKQQGRREISRYHAADCSSRVNEFEGWTTDEQIKLMQGLVKVFQQHPANTLSYSCDLRELVEEIPETKSDPKAYAYELLIKYLMLEIGAFCDQLRPRPLVTLIHDRCEHDVDLLKSFNTMVNDPTFRQRDRFVSIVPESWEHCIPLQPADLIAYENFKEYERSFVNRKRRKTLEILLDLDSFGGRGRILKRDAFTQIKKVIDEKKFVNLGVPNKG